MCLVLDRKINQKKLRQKDLTYVGREVLQLLSTEPGNLWKTLWITYPRLDS